MNDGLWLAGVARAEDLDRGAFQESSFLWPDEDDPAWFIRLWWRLVDGRYEVSGFEMSARRDNPAPLTATLLRSVNLGSLIEEGRRYQIAIEKESAANLENDQEYRNMFAERGIDPYKLLQNARREIEVLENPPARSRYDEEHWKLVTDVYDRAWAAGSTPTRAVADHWRVARSTAAKWVSNCRKRGLLPPTQKTRPRGNPMIGGVDGVGSED